MPLSPALRRLCAASLALLLSACASTGPLSSAPVADYRDSIALGGRLSVNYEKDGKPESVTGTFNWTQTPAAIDVSLASPLGQTMATIQVTPQSATLIQAGQAPRVAKDIDTLSAQTLGWSLPVSGLRYWLQGYATGADGKRFAASPANNRITTADGWSVSFVSWQDEHAPRPQPKRIDAQRRATLDSGELAIRIVIDGQP